MLVMVRTCCCESYRSCGEFCSVCPHRLENQQAAMQTQQVMESPGCSGVCCRAHRRKAQAKASQPELVLTSAIA
jgi:hypothetical protein